MNLQDILYSLFPRPLEHTAVSVKAALMINACCFAENWIHLADGQYNTITSVVCFVGVLVVNGHSYRKSENFGAHCTSLTDTTDIFTHQALYLNLMIAVLS